MRFNPIWIAHALGNVESSASNHVGSSGDRAMPSSPVMFCVMGLFGCLPTKPSTRDIAEALHLHILQLRIQNSKEAWLSLHRTAATYRNGFLAGVLAAFYQPACKMVRFAERNGSIRILLSSFCVNAMEIRKWLMRNCVQIMVRLSLVNMSIDCRREQSSESMAECLLIVPSKCSN